MVKSVVFSKCVDKQCSNQNHGADVHSKSTGPTIDRTRRRDKLARNVARNQHHENRNQQSTWVHPVNQNKFLETIN